MEDDKKLIEKYADLKILIRILCFQEELKQKIKISFKNNQKSKMIYDDIIIIKKNPITVYKTFFDYKNLSDTIKNHNSQILTPIKDEYNFLNYEKLNEKILLSIINQLPKELVNKIENTNKNELVESFKKQNNKEGWENKYIELDNPEKDTLSLLDDFEIINNNIFSFLKDREMQLKEFLLGKCIIGDNYIFITINDLNNDSLYNCQIRQFNEKKGEFQIEYIFDRYKINDLDLIFNYFKKNGIKHFINSFNKKEKIKDFLYDNICFKVNSRKIKEAKNILGDIIKAIIILTIYHKNLIQKQNFIDKKNEIGTLEEIILIKKNFFELFYLNEIRDLININQKINENINNLEINNLSLDFVDNIINDLDIKTLKQIEKSYFGKKLIYKENGKKINFIKSKNVPIYNDFVIINKNIFSNLFNKIFKVNFDNHKISFVSINDRDILKIQNKNINIIYIGDLNIDKNFYNIQYILDFEKLEQLDDALNYILKNGFNDYLNNILIFSKEEDCISPIFSVKGIAGYCYKYSNKIQDYSKIPTYEEYLNNKSLTNILSLYMHYKIINNKLNTYDKCNITSKKYYLINHKFLTDIKNEYDYISLFEYLDKNINNKKILEKICRKNIYFLIRILSPEIRNKYSNNNIDQNKYKNKQIEPDIIAINYCENKSKNNYLSIYNNFEIININLLDEKKDNNNILGECTFNTGYIIINLPNYLNKKFVSLIGVLDNENAFIIKYILAYNKEDIRKNHLLEISNDLKNYLDKLNFVGNSSPIIIGEEKQIIGIIIKYCDGKKENINKEKKNIKDNNDNNIIKNNNKKDKIENNNKINNDFISNNCFNYFNNINNFINNYNNMIFNNNFNFFNNLNNDNINNFINNNQIKSEIINIDLRNYFNYCPKIGLQNIGATCYMNATLQCFCHIKEFIEFFKFNLNNIDFGKNKNNLSYSFKILIDNLWPNDYISNSKKFFPPEEFKQKISDMNPLFEGIAANDAKDLVNFIIMTLHSEINNKNIINESDNNIQIDQSNKQLVFNYYIKDFINKNQSVISNLFYSTNCNTTECSNCHIQIYNYQIYFFIIFPLEEVRKFKIQFNQFYNYNNNEVNIYDCFEYDKKINIMNGENSMYCNNCQMNCDFFMTTNLVTGPNILILLLNRGKGKEFDVKINFYEFLDLSNYIEFQQTGVNYKLIGVISHIGESGMGGHFIAYCRDPITDKWHKYNDAIVTDVKDFQNEIINFAMPYLLFYQKINNIVYNNI